MLITTLSFQNHSVSRVNKALNLDPEALDQWLKGNKLSFNVTLKALYNNFNYTEASCLERLN